MIKEIQLNEYQKDMLRQIEDAFGTHQSVMVQMPTGTGKTVLISEVVKREERRVKNPCVWIVVHRRELVEQIKETLERRLGTSLDAEREKSNVIEVFSIQWLSRHYQELEERPSLIVIDEAHHALAKTYAEMMNAYPEAKKLGVTATPCRLNKRGFTDLFEVLLTSHSISNFIKDGYLSDFDYVSLNPSSEDQKKIDRMSKRATDGDYSIAEMQDVLDRKPSIERLYQTIKDFAAEKKGIVYAINIEHAEHIAAYYREQGMLHHPGQCRTVPTVWTSHHGIELDSDVPWQPEWHGRGEYGKRLCFENHWSMLQRSEERTDGHVQRHYGSDSTS